MNELRFNASPELTAIKMESTPTIVIGQAFTLPVTPTSNYTDEGFSDSHPLLLN